MKSYKKVTIFAGRSLMLISAIVGFHTTNAWADKGFRHDPTLLPASVKNAWNSVFLAAPKALNGVIASAVLVAKEEVAPNQYYLTFISNDHVVSDICGPQLGHCDNLELTASKGLKVDVDEKMIVDEIGNDDLTIGKVEILRRSTNPDLALIRALGTGPKFSRLQPITVTPYCGNFKKDQQVYVIGYPIVAERTNFDIEHKDLVIRRWSTGHLVTNTKSTDAVDGSIRYFTGSTADSVNGNSGGATLNLRGELIGIHSGTRGGELPGSPYVGNEYSSPKIHHAVFARCEYLDDFINMRTVSVNPEDYYKRPRVASNQDSGSIVRTSYSK